MSSKLINDSFKISYLIVVEPPDGFGYTGNNRAYSFPLYALHSDNPLTGAVHRIAPPSPQIHTAEEESIATELKFIPVPAD